jgi:transcriptional regulator with XRE-family HTH domain
VKKHSPRKYFKDEALLNQIGAKIREIRIKKNVSQEMLANDCEIDYSQVNRMELGKVNFSISYLYKIAAALEVNPKELLP